VAPRAMTPEEFAVNLLTKVAPGLRNHAMAALTTLQLATTGNIRPKPMANFTTAAQQALALARREAERLNHGFVGTEHLLLGIIRLGAGGAVTLLQQHVDLAALRTKIEEQINSTASKLLRKNAPYTPKVKQSLALAGKAAVSLGHDHVGTAHLLVGLV